MSVDATDTGSEGVVRARRAPQRQAYPIRILISYRRDDTQAWAGRIAKALKDRFGKANVFQDIGGIDPGQDFETVIDDAIRCSDLVLVIIGRQWLTATDDRGRRRLDDPQDRHRREVETAMDQQKALFPVLVEGTVMPGQDELPGPDVWSDADGTEHRSPGLKRLPRYNAYKIVEPFDISSRGLIQAIKELPRPVRLPPPPPADLVAYATGGTTMWLSWKLQPDVCVKGCRIARDGVVVGATEKPQETAWADSGVAPGTTYTYSVVAFDHWGNESAPASTSATTLSATPPLPPQMRAPTDLAANATGATSVSLSWSPSSDARVAGYRVSRDRGVVATTTATSWRDDGLAPATTYGYAVVAFDAAGNTSPAATASVTTPAEIRAPLAPGDLAATPLGATSIDLSWTDSTNGQAAGYRVSRDGTEVATVTETSWTDAGLTQGTTYEYSVVALDLAGDSSPAATVSATTPADTQAPTPPSDLTATPASPTSIDLSWTASSDDVGVTGYRVSRDGVVIASAVAEISYTDAGLSPGTRYSYSVAAFDAAGNESAPASAGATTLSPPGSRPPSLREAVDQANLKCQVLPDGTLAFPFRSERADDLVILARALSDEIVLFSVRLPKPGMFGQEAGLRNLLRASFQANYTKVMASASLDLMAASELHPSMLTSGVAEGLIRGLASLGDLRSGDLKDWQTMTAVIRGSRGTQENHIVVDPDAAREAIRRMAEESGLAVQESAGVIVFEFPLVGLEGSHLKLLVNASRQVISIGAFLGMKPQGNKVQFMQQLLQLNQVADVARVGLDADDEVAFLYEVPVVTPGLLERVKTQFMLLSVGVAAIAAGDLRR